MSIVFGFHRRDAVLNVHKRRPNGETVVYDEHRIRRRSRVIQVAIDARAQRFPAETPYRYLPLADEEHDNRWNEDTRQTVLKDYNLLNLGI